MIIQSHAFEVTDSVWVRIKLSVHRFWGNGVLPKLALAGLPVVLLSVSGFAMWSAWSTSQAAERAIASSTLSDHYNSAAEAVSAQ